MFIGTLLKLALFEYGFPTKLVHLVIKTPSFSISINGELAGFFTGGRGPDVLLYLCFSYECVLWFIGR